MRVKNNWKLYSNDESEVEQSGNQRETVSLDTLAKLTGFPVELIKAELLLHDMNSSEPISLENLRSHMVKFLQRSMAKEESMFKEANP